MGMILFVIYLPILMASIVVASLIFWAWRILGRFEISHSYERRIVSVGGSLSLAGIIMLALSGLLLFTRVFGL